MNFLLAQPKGSAAGHCQVLLRLVLHQLLVVRRVRNVYIWTCSTDKRYCNHSRSSEAGFGVCGLVEHDPHTSVACGERELYSRVIYKCRICVDASSFWNFPLWKNLVWNLFRTLGILIDLKPCLYRTLLKWKWLCFDWLHNFALFEWVNTLISLLSLISVWSIVCVFTQII